MANTRRMHGPSIPPCNTYYVHNISLKVLVVEDNPYSRDLLCDMLSILGHTVSGAATAEEAAGLVAGERFELLLTDINLPGMSGIDFAKTVVQVMPDIKIIFASGYGYLVMDKMDFDFFLLPKPYGLAQLSHTLEQVLASL